MILLLVLSSAAASATPLEWPQRLAGMRQCYAARQIFMEATGDASSLLWWASTDNHRNGYINPSVVIEARQRVQELIAAADWRFTKLAAQEDVHAQGCRYHALEAGSRIMQLTREVLARGELSPVASSNRQERPRNRLR